MNPVHDDIVNKLSTLEYLTHTLLYEGYSLFPYHRSAVKNQKPVPFGVVYPREYHTWHLDTHAVNQTECIIAGHEDPVINVSVRFLQLKKIELFKKNPGKGKPSESFTPVNELTIGGHFYQAGWQTIEHQVTVTGLHNSKILKKRKVFTIDQEEEVTSQPIYNEQGEMEARQDKVIRNMNGMVTIEADHLKNMPCSFRIRVCVSNTTPMPHAGSASRDDAILQSFLSTHTVINTMNAAFISAQDPPAKWKESIAQCQNLDTWPILIEESNTTLLSSPIILYDYPKINPLSKGDLFDGTEIEEALMLHFSAMSDEEKLRIAQSDEKLSAMLQKVGQVSPQEIIKLHGIMQPVKSDKDKIK